MLLSVFRLCFKKPRLRYYVLSCCPAALREAHALSLHCVVNVIVKMASWLQRISVLAEKTALNKGIKVKFNAI